MDLNATVLRRRIQQMKKSKSSRSRAIANCSIICQGQNTNKSVNSMTVLWYIGQWKRFGRTGGALTSTERSRVQRGFYLWLEAEEAGPVEPLERQIKWVPRLLL